MENKTGLLLFAVMSFVLMVPYSFAQTCYSKVNDIPANCTSAITQDTKNGACRTILCGSGTNTIKVFSCDKPDSGAKQYFEMYRQAYSGSSPKVCIGNICIKNEGYKRSSNYPICVETSATNDTQPENNQTGNTIATILIDEYVSRDHNLVPLCKTNFIPTKFIWDFGDGIIREKNQSNIRGNQYWEYYYHVYPRNGTYTVKCTASDNSGSIATGSRTVTIKTEATEAELEPIAHSDYGQSAFDPYIFRPFVKHISGSTYKIGGYAIGLPRDNNNEGQYGWWAFATDFYSHYTSTHDNILTITFPEPGAYSSYVDIGINQDELMAETYIAGRALRGCSNARTMCNRATGYFNLTVPDLGTRTFFGIEAKKISGTTYDMRCVSYASDNGAQSRIDFGSGVQWAVLYGNEWARHTFPNEGNYEVTCYQRIQEAIDKVYQKTLNVNTSQGNSTGDDPGASSTLRLEWAHINRQWIDGNNRQITVSPGQTISGEVALSWNSFWPPSISTPLIMTPNWGNHQASYVLYGNASVSGSWDVQVSKTAPTTPGTYYLIFAFRAEIDGGDVASMTNWAKSGGEVWNDGNDIADWTTTMIDNANSNGRTQVNILFDSGYKNLNVPATAIKILVKGAANNETTGNCFSTVKDIPVTCTNTITQDTSSGACRTVVCGINSNTIKVLACDKPDSGTKQYFEVYRQAYSGSSPKVCLGNVCIQNEGYKKSSNYPICT